MDVLPTNPASYGGELSAPPTTPTTLNELTMQQIDGVIARLPPGEREAFNRELARCRGGNLTAGLPMMFFLVGGSHLLNKVLKLGPWKVHIYAMLGLGGLALSGMFSVNNSCAQRVQEMLAHEYDKQNSGITPAISRQNSGTNDQFSSPNNPDEWWGDSFNSEQQQERN